MSHEEIAQSLLRGTWNGLSEEEQFDMCLDYHWDEDRFVNSLHSQIEGPTNRVTTAHD